MKIYKVIKLKTPRGFNIRNYIRLDFKRLRKYHRPVRKIVVLTLLLMGGLCFGRLVFSTDGQQVTVINSEELSLGIGEEESTHLTDSKTIQALHNEREKFEEQKKLDQAVEHEKAEEAADSSETLETLENHEELGNEKEKRSLWQIFIHEILPFGTDKSTDAKKQVEQEDLTVPESEKTNSSAQAIRSEYFAVEQPAYLASALLNTQVLDNDSIAITPLGSDPQILIFHTHSQEGYSDSRPGIWEDTVVGVGQKLSDILSKEYGISVVHDMGRYDVDETGGLDRSGSYERMEESVRSILEKYPSIEVVIDLHRDGVGEDVRLVTDMNGESTARVMFVNGVCCLEEDGFPKPVENLENPYLAQNLAFSYQMQRTLNELYPGFARKIYIKPYRYSLHMKPMSLLVEVGANTNTVKEAMNAAKPLAQALNHVLIEN